MIKTVLFDLDDTIFDHKYSRLCALRALKNLHANFINVPLEDLEKEHEKLLMGNYLKVLDRSLTLIDSMVERTYMIFEKYGVNLTEDDAIKYTNHYKEIYEANRQAIPGVKELLSHLKPIIKIGIVSNGIYDIQIEKVKLCGIEELIDFLVFSEDVKARKPDKAIFETALGLAGARPEESMFIGDSWKSDIIGASNCGIRPIWLNRYDEVCPNCAMAFEINSFMDINKITGYILEEGFTETITTEAR